MPVESVELAACDLLRLRAELEVLEPVELRDYLRDVAARVVAIYTTWLKEWIEDLVLVIE